MLKDMASLLEDHGGTFFLSEKSLTLQRYLNWIMLNQLLYGMGACTTPVAAEDQRCFSNTQPVHQDSNKPHQGFHHSFKGL